MTVVVTEGSAIERAGITTALLRHFDWAPTSKVPGKYEVWTTTGSEMEVLVPLDPQRGDFNLLLDRALKALSHTHGGEVSSVHNLLALRRAGNLDSTQWKKQTPVSAGLISWVDGESLFKAAEDSLIASAKATHEKRIQHGKSSAYIARKFLESTLMGQTEIGSFVITAHTPAGARFHMTKRSETRSAADWRNAEMVTGREILATLERSLEAVRSGLDEYRSSPNIEGFVPLVEDGVSFELVRSLKELTDGGDAAVSIERFSDEADRAPRRVEIAFDAVESAVLERVADKFVEAKPPMAVRVSGEVSLLDNSTTSPVHLVRLDIKSGSQVKRARVRLTPEQYELAVQAHAQHSWLKVAGQLQRDGNAFWLYGASGVELVDPADGPESRAMTMFSDDD